MEPRKQELFTSRKKEETEMKSILGDLKISKLKQIFEQPSATRHVCNFTHFTFVFIKTKQINSIVSVQLVPL